LSNSHREYDISSLKIVNFGAEMMPSSLLDRARNELPNIDFRQTFGTTETGTMTVIRHPENPLLIKIPNSKIIDSKLYIKSTHGMIGYLGEDSPIEDGYFPSGDVVEEHGDYIRILGRQTDVVNIGGEKVLLTEVEDALLGHPDVQDVVVSNEKNVIMGNILVAQIVWNASSDCKKEIRQYLENKYKKCFIPTKIKVVNEIPHSTRFKKIRGL
jgi:acyl-coenzyme A synthetase/AMP-(fatty) acid ligase